MRYIVEIEATDAEGVPRWYAMASFLDTGGNALDRARGYSQIERQFRSRYGAVNPNPRIVKESHNGTREIVT